jgi:hypothetical protein
MLAPIHYLPSTIKNPLLLIAEEDVFYNVVPPQFIDVISTSIDITVEPVIAY